jgi:hypothetical protein
VTETVVIKGLDEVTRKIDNLEDLKKLKPALEGAAEHVEGVVKEYPPKSEANDPRRRRWYQRGYGSKYRRKDGSVKGYKTSKILAKQWSTKRKRRGFTQIIGNPVSYGPYVQSRAKQAKFHEARGWKTIEDVAEQEVETVVAYLKSKVDRILSA